MDTSTTRLCSGQFTHRVNPSVTYIFIMLTILLSHVGFVYGQTSEMWLLYSQLEVDCEITAHSLASRLAFASLHLSNPTHIMTRLNHTIEAFTYWDAIRGLWTGHTGEAVPDPRFENPGPGPWGKVSAVLLIVFSAVWPHVKLMALNWQYHRKVKDGEEESRTTMLYWLDTFGKWSLADVFVICTLLAVLNVDIPVQAEKLADALVAQLREIVHGLSKDATAKQAARAICQQLFYYGQKCDFPAGEEVKFDCVTGEDDCSLCACRLEKAFPQYELLILAVNALLRGVKAKGELVAILRVKGRLGIYVFCLATLASLSLSWIVDAIDHRTRSKRKSQNRTIDEDAFFHALSDLRENDLTSRMSLVFRGTRLASMVSIMATPNMPTPSGSTSPLLMPSPFPGQDDTEIAISEPLLVAAPHPTHETTTAAPPALPETWSNRSTAIIKPVRWLYPMSIASLVLSVAAVFVPTMERKIPGSIADLVTDDLNVEFTRQYSIHSLVALAGEAGGFDLLLMFSFGLFVMVGPLIRAFLVCFLTFVPLPSRWQRKIATAINTCGVFAGWDVLLLALVLVKLEMPRITQGIISPSVSVCRLLHDLGMEPYCLSIDFLLVSPWFLIIPLATICLVLSSTRLIRIAFFTFDPFGDGYVGAPRIVMACVE